MKHNLLTENIRLLVTGGLGFIGSNFILHVLAKYPKCHIVNIDAKFMGSNKQNLKTVNTNKNISNMS